MRTSVLSLWRGFLTRIESWFKDIWAGSGLIPVPEMLLHVLQCEFCKKNPETRARFASYSVRGTTQKDVVVRIPCCTKHKRAIEREEPWIVNNLRIAYKLERWSIHEPFLD